MIRVVLTGGGTGGHLYPGLSIVEAMKKSADCNVTFIGTKQGIESRVIPQAGYALKTIWMAGLHRGRIVKNLLFPVKMIISLIQSIAYLLIIHPDVVIATGGYVSWPVMTAAWWLRKPRFIQEQNQKPGLVTRFLASHMNRVFLSFEASKKYFKKQDHLIISGNPTRDGIEQGIREDACTEFNLDPNKLTLFIFGGSQGALGINQHVLDNIQKWLEFGSLQVLWATGPRWIEEIEQNIKSMKERVKVTPYINNMAAAYAVSDVILARSGASTIAEITRLGKAAVYVPFPGAADNHQEANARVLAEAEAAEIVMESEFKSGKLTRTIHKLVNDQALRESLARKAKTFGRPDAAGTIANIILHLIMTKKEDI